MKNLLLAIAVTALATAATARELKTNMTIYQGQTPVGTFNYIGQNNQYVIFETSSGFNLSTGYAYVEISDAPFSQGYWVTAQPMANMPGCGGTAGDHQGNQYSHWGYLNVQEVPNYPNGFELIIGLCNDNPNQRYWIQ